MTQWPQHIVYQSNRGKIIYMDSMGYIDERNDVTDVLICGSHSALCAVELVSWVRPRGLIGHDAGIGLREGGISGLKHLEEIGIPGAACGGEFAQIGNGESLYHEGIITAVNKPAKDKGIKLGMTTKEAAMIMLEWVYSSPPIKKVQKILLDSEHGKVIGIDTIKYGDQNINNTVICMGSHAGESMAKYVLDLKVNLYGIITNDVGLPKGNSGISGLPILNKYGIPVATVSVNTAEVGNSESTYQEGIISTVNETAEKIGVKKGMDASVAAKIMLKRGVK
ncbi:hypothetical protein [Bacillus sp. 1P02SD]|uniref:hypothetical protein n=1 Tax=Bacillus sp. 1P02SD TaxID=3132264 RepID=UPI0039A014F8